MGGAATMGGAAASTKGPAPSQFSQAQQPMEDPTEKFMPQGSVHEAKSGTPTQGQDLRKQIQGSQSRKQSEFHETRGGFDVVSQAARSQP